jgi:hypothetical protein
MRGVPEVKSLDGRKAGATGGGWEINDMVDCEGLLKADRKVWSDPCKHQLSQQVNMAPFSLYTATVEKLFGLGRVEVAVRWSGAAGRMRTLYPSPSTPSHLRHPCMLDYNLMHMAMRCRYLEDYANGPGAHLGTPHSDGSLAAPESHLHPTTATKLFVVMF